MWTSQFVESSFWRNRRIAANPCDDTMRAVVRHSTNDRPTTAQLCDRIYLSEVVLD